MYKGGGGGSNREREREREMEEEVDNKENPNNHHVLKVPKGKSCKGCLYYSSVLNSKSRNPTCVGISRTLPKVPSYIEGQIEVDSKERRNLTDFKYGCVGYSVYLDKKGASDQNEKVAELPYCVGLEVLMDKRTSPSTANHVPAHAHRRQDGNTSPQTRTYKPAQSPGSDYLTRFSRNANLVASGVARNMNRVGHYVKHRINNILYPYRRPPK